MPFPTYELGCDSCGGVKRDQDIKIRAYELWEQSGRPEGMRSPSQPWHDYFWEKAKTELLRNEQLSAALTGSFFNR